MPLYSAKVSADRSIKLPEELCDALGISAGSEVEFFLTLDGYVHFHVLRDSFSDFGVRHKSPSLSIREIDDAIAEAVVEKNAPFTSVTYSARKPAAE
jgi:bifunctional DNA-binding transcriptional regulator/antitoxin component of YhaV-PrlF toxin-antitoxin module